MKKHLLLSFVIMMCGFTSFSQQSYEIYPVPQKQMLNPGQANITGQVNIVAEPGIDEVTLARARQIMDEQGISTTISEKPVNGLTNLLLGINGSKQIVDNEVTLKGLDRNVFSQPKYDRHIVSLTSDDNGNAQFIVLGENTDAAFYGLATIEQMLDRGLTDLPCVVIYDYADQRSRGVIEGYYGVPYNAEVTKDLFRFMARYKMNTYMYGAKSDPYHTRYWDKPYPETITPEQKRIGYLSQEMLGDITKTAHDSKVNFIWAIHPGNAFIDKEDDKVIDRIMDKFQSMYDLGVRQFGVFVDDVGVPYEEDIQLLGAKRLTDLQNRIEQRWNSDKNASPADTVKPLHYVPQLYAYSWATPDKARGFFESLSGTPDKIDIYITGANVWSVPNSNDLELVKSWLGRDVAWWWNYPCNDNDMTKLFTMDMYSNFRDEKHIDNLAKMEPDLKGAATIIANPMQQGEISKIGLFGVGDYAWNNSGFNNDRSWEASIVAVVGPEKAAALKKVLPYLRYYDTDALAYYINNYKDSHKKGRPNARPVINKLTGVLAACEQLEEMAGSSSESDRLFYEDMRPWLSKLETMINITIDLLEGKDISGYPDLESDEAFEVEVLNGMGEDIAIDVKIAEPSAVVLRPFIEWLKEQNKNTESQAAK